MNLGAIGDFKAIEREERERAAREADAAPPLAMGDLVAWVTTRFGGTHDVSELHRVGLPIGGQDYTTCREEVPAYLLRLPLGPGLVRTLPRCKFCEAEHARLTRETREHAA